MRHNPRKRFGQNFLQDQRVIEQIIQALHPQKSDNVVEIGPGLGALTLPLLRFLPHLQAVEIDHDVQAYWQALPEAQGKLQLIPADALTVDYSQWGPQLRLIGNLPYNISTPLLIHFLKYASHIKDMHFMLQKEVVERLAAVPGTKDYGRLTVLLQYHAEVDYLFDVPPEAFTPAPKVDSAVVRIMPYQEPPYPKVPVAQLEAVVAKAFSMRRKTLKNNLKELVSAEELQGLGIDASQRAEQLTVEQYVQLTQYILNK